MSKFEAPGAGSWDSSNYRKRVLHKLREELGLPKLTLQVIRRTIATLAQKKGIMKGVQGILRHARPGTTTDVYMQEIPESVRARVNSIHTELKSDEGKRRRASEGANGEFEASEEKREAGSRRDDYNNRNRADGGLRGQGARIYPREGPGICDKMRQRSGKDMALND